MKHRLALNAVTLQYIMISIIIVSIIALGFVFYGAQMVLGSKVVETDHARIDAELAQQEIDSLQGLKKNLADDKDIIAKTAQIVADSQEGMFQDQVTADVTAYANTADITIRRIDFGVKPGESPAGANTGAVTQRRTTVTVTVASGASVTSLLTFLKAIENNVTKTQLTGLNIKPDQTNRALLQESTLILEVYLR